MSRRRVLAVAVLLIVALAPVTLEATELSTLYLVVTDRTIKQLVRFNPVTGELIDTFGDILIGNPDAIVFGPDQNLYVANGFSNQVRRYNGSTGEFMDIFVNVGHLSYASGLSFGPYGDLYVSSWRNHKVVRFDGGSGEYMGSFIAAGSGGLENPVYLLFHDRHLYVASQNNHQVLRFDAATGVFVDRFVGTGSGELCAVNGLPAGEGGLCGPHGLAFGPDGNFYVASVLTGEILRYDGQTGRFMDVFVSGLSYPTEFAFHHGFLFVGSRISEEPPRWVVHHYDGATGAFQGVFASGTTESVHGLMFYSWESRLTESGGESAAASNDSGTRVVVWTDEDGNGSGILAQLYDAMGSSVGPPFPVNTTRADDQHSPAVAFAGSGGFVVTWTSGDRDKTGQGAEAVFARFFDVDGSARTGEVEVSEDGDASSPDVAATVAQVAVAWEQHASHKTRQEEDAILARLFNPSGTPQTDPFAVVQGGDTEVGSPAVAALAEGTVVVWEQHQSHKTAQGAEAIFARSFDAIGTPTGSAIAIDDGSSGAPSSPDVTASSGGDTVVAWQREAPGQGRSEIFALRLDAAKAAVGEAMKVNRDSDRDQRDPSVSVNLDGAFTVAWASRDTDDSRGIFARRVGVDDTLAKTEIVIVDSDPGDGYADPDLSQDLAGDLTVVFDRENGSGLGGGVYARATTAGTPGACTADEVTLCLNQSRFRVQITWRDGNNNTGVGRATALTSDTGYFWFFDQTNVEVVIKVLDGTWLNHHYWVFLASLSNVEYTITVTDTQTGYVKSYVNPLGNFASLGDTEALPEHRLAAPPTPEVVAIPVDHPDPDPALRLRQLEAVDIPAQATTTVGSCSPGQTRLCLNNQRFQVELDWRDQANNTGDGQAVQLTADTGYFWFFDDANVEVVIKVLDGTWLNHHYWVFYASLSNVEYTITVTDTETDRVKTYSNSLGQFASVGDTTAFPSP